MITEIQKQIITWVGSISTLSLLGTILLLFSNTTDTNSIIILIGITSTGIGILGGIITGQKTTENKEILIEEPQFNE